MKDRLTQLGFLILGSTLLLSAHIQPTQAASFEFSLINNDGSGSFGVGSLSFTESPLTAIGSEEVALSQLPNASFNYFFSSSIAGVLPIIGYSGFVGSPSSVLFKFEGGDLIGMTFRSEVVPVDSTFFPGGSTGVSVTGNAQLSVAGAYYTDNFSGVSVYGGYDPSTGEFFEVTNPINNYSFGRVNFTTIEPIAAIPEPLSLLGAATALGFGAFFKKRLSN